MRKYLVFLLTAVYISQIFSEERVSEPSQGVWFKNGIPVITESYLLSCISILSFIDLELNCIQQTQISNSQAEL